MSDVRCNFRQRGHPCHCEERSGDAIPDQLCAHRLVGDCRVAALLAMTGTAGHRIAEPRALFKSAIRRDPEAGHQRVRRGKTQCAARGCDACCDGRCWYPAAVLAEVVLGGAQGLRGCSRSRGVPRLRGLYRWQGRAPLPLSLRGAQRRSNPPREWRSLWVGDCFVAALLAMTGRWRSAQWQVWPGSRMCITLSFWFAARTVGTGRDAC